MPMSVLAVLAALAISAWAKAAPGVFATLLTSVFSRRVPPASSALASPGLECPLGSPRLPAHRGRWGRAWQLRRPPRGARGSWGHQRRRRSGLCAPRDRRGHGGGAAWGPG